MEDRSAALPPNRRHRRLQDLSLTLPPPPPPPVQPAAPDNFSYNFTHFQNGLNLNESTFPEGPDPRINITPDDDVWKDNMSPQPSDFYPHLGMAVDPPVQMSQWMQLSSSSTPSFDFPAQNHHVLMKPAVVDNVNHHRGNNDHGEVSENTYVVDEHVERRQMRMIKNRESAARSRARKQAYTNQLEQKVIWLRKTISWLKKQQEVCQLLFSSPKAAEKRYQLRRTSSANF